MDIEIVEHLSWTLIYIYEILSWNHYNIYLCWLFHEGCRKPGVYGSDCNIPCPINCKDNMCHIQLGHCFTCKPGWTGESCITSISEHDFIHSLNVSMQSVL